jgi:hypothetical protein
LLSLAYEKAVTVIYDFRYVVGSAKTAYNTYCGSKPEGCKKEMYDENQGLPEKGIDW